MTVTKLILLYALTLMDEDWLELLLIYFLPSTMVIYWAWQGYIGEYTPSGLNNISLGASRLWIYCTTPLEYILQCTLVTPTILLQCHYPLITYLNTYCEMGRYINWDATWFSDMITIWIFPIIRLVRTRWHSHENSNKMLAKICCVHS